jgi:hypothetical protein
MVTSFARGRARFAVAPIEARTLDGIVFASKKEMMRYADLKLLQRAGVICELECQPSYDVMINGEKLCRYTADFRYRDVQFGNYTTEEVKSSGTEKDAAYRLRMRAAELFFGIKVSVIVR